MTRASVTEYLAAVRARYGRAGRGEKGRMLSEAMAVTGYHRKALIRRLNGVRRERAARHGRQRVYGVELIEPLRRLWEATGWVCARRLQPFLSELVPFLERQGRLRLEPGARSQLLSMSVSTVERLLRTVRERQGHRPCSTTKPGSLLKAAIPIRTFSEWDERRPGFLEVDLVAHCGESTEGFYLNTLTAVDIATGWVERQAVWGKRQDRVGSALHGIGTRLPFRWLGLDSDNGSEFINQDLLAYCRRKRITFTRSRPYKKNDNAHVEEKNWTAVRRIVGYQRFSSAAALETLNQLYGLLRWQTNCFQPVMQLQTKTRHGARVHKVYDQAQTPYQRLLRSGALEPGTAAQLSATYQRLDPFDLARQIDRLRTLLATLAEKPASVTPILTQRPAVR